MQRLKPIMVVTSVVTVLTALGIGCHKRASAGFVTYTSQSQFAAASINTTNIDFEGLAHLGSFTYYGNPGSLTVGGVTFASNSPLFVQNVNYYGTGAFLSPQQTNPENVSITLPESITAVESNYFTDFTTTVTLNTGQSFMIPGGTFPNLMYFGFTTDAPVASISLAVAGNGIDLDNFTFGQAIPEPASIMIFASGLLLSAVLCLAEKRCQRPLSEARHLFASPSEND